MKAIRGKSILVVDDDAGMLRALGKLLRGEGAAVTCVAWAGDAIDALTRQSAPPRPKATNEPRPLRP